MAKEPSKPSQKSLPWNWIITGGILVLILLGAFITYRLNTVETSLAPQVTVDEAFDLREEGVFVLDVRQQDEWDEAHIPGATHIPLDQLPSRLEEIPAGQQVLVYCRTGNRSQQGRDILLTAGFEQVTSMSGGITVWSAAGYPTETGR